jgi:hypothetical protein
LLKPFHFIQQPKHQQSGIRLIQNSIKFANELDNLKFADALQKNTKEQIANIDLASPLGTLEKAIGDHHQIWQLIIEEGSTFLLIPK